MARWINGADMTFILLLLLMACGSAHQGLVAVESQKVNSNRRPFQLAGGEILS
jgi:hypothetical protein